MCIRDRSTSRKHDEWYRYTKLNRSSCSSLEGGIALLLSCTCLVALIRVACKGVSPFRSLSECQILPCPESYVLRTPNCYIRLTPEALSRIACNSINSRRNSEHVLTIGGGRGLCYCRDRRRSSASSSIDTRRVHVAVLWVFIRTTHHLWADCAYYRIHISYNKVFWYVSNCVYFLILICIYFIHFHTFHISMPLPLPPDWDIFMIA